MTLMVALGWTVGIEKSIHREMRRARCMEERNSLLQLGECETVPKAGAFDDVDYRGYIYIVVPSLE